MIPGELSDDWSEALLVTWGLQITVSLEFEIYDAFRRFSDGFPTLFR